MAGAEQVWLVQAEQQETHTDTDTLFFCSICFRDALFALQPYFFIQSCCVSLSTFKKKKKANKLTTLSRTRIFETKSALQFKHSREYLVQNVNA